MNANLSEFTVIPTLIERIANLFHFSQAGDTWIKLDQVQHEIRRFVEDPATVEAACNKVAKRSGYENIHEINKIDDGLAYSIKLDVEAALSVLGLDASARKDELSLNECREVAIIATAQSPFAKHVDRHTLEYIARCAINAYRSAISNVEAPSMRESGNEYAAIDTRSAGDDYLKYNGVDPK